MVAAGDDLPDIELRTAFIDAMACVCTPVSVVTAMDGDRPHGTTVSAFNSLSADPPMVLVSLDRCSDLLAIIQHTGRFGLNVLGATDAATATKFARKGADKFDHVEWELHADVPQIAGAAAWLACSVTTVVQGGDHLVLLGSVIDVKVQQASPLIYHSRTFGTPRSLVE